MRAGLRSAVELAEYDAGGFECAHDVTPRGVGASFAVIPDGVDKFVGELVEFAVPADHLDRFGCARFELA